MNKILIFTKNDIKELFDKIRDIVDAKELRLSKEQGQIITESGSIINIRRLNDGARGYRANIILYDGNFTTEEKWYMQCKLLPNGVFRKLQINKLRED